MEQVYKSRIMTRVYEYRLKLAIRRQRAHLYYRFQEKANATPDRVFLIFEDKTYTFRQLEQGMGCV